MIIGGEASIRGRDLIGGEGRWHKKGPSKSYFQPLGPVGPPSTLGDTRGACVGRELRGPTHKRLVRPECIMPAHHLPVRCGDTPISLGGDIWGPWAPKHKGILRIRDLSASVSCRPTTFRSGAGTPR